MIDINHVISATPYKRIYNGYQKMKENYTQETANEFHDVYSKEPLSSIIENSSMIFTEAYYGLPFYKDIVLNENLCLFPILESEYNKVEEFVEAHKDKMNEDQRSLYTEFVESFKDFIDKNKTVSIVYSVLTPVDESTGYDFTLSDALYAHDVEAVKEYVSNLDNGAKVFAVVPYIAGYFDSGEMSSIYESVGSKYSDYNVSLDTYLETVIPMNKLASCDTYRLALGNIINTNVRSIIQGYMTESVSKKLESICKESKEDAIAVIHSDPETAVLNIFDCIEEAALYKEDNDAIKKDINSAFHLAYERTLDYMTAEYTSIDNESAIAEGYSILNESMSLESAIGFINSKDEKIKGESNFF